MITFPNAKINLGLNIVARRDDGYHDLETLFYPIPLCDALEVTVSPNETSLVQYGLNLDCNPEENLVLRAYQLLNSKFDLPCLTISLYKKIPSGAGMGGGSSDAAFMLRSLNQLFKLNLSSKELEMLSNKMGADCPFFIHNNPLFAQGTGNLFTPIDFSLKGKIIVIVKPHLHISTKEAFAQITPTRPINSILSIIQQDISIWREVLVNDFESFLFKSYPVLQMIKKDLYDHGALYAAMSGSGSALYGIFESEINIPNNWTNYFTFQGILE